MKSQIGAVLTTFFGSYYRKTNIGYYGFLIVLIRYDENHNLLMFSHSRLFQHEIKLESVCPIVRDQLGVFQCPSTNNGIINVLLMKRVLIMYLNVSTV